MPVAQAILIHIKCCKLRDVHESGLGLVSVSTSCPQDRIKTKRTQHFISRTVKVTTAGILLNCWFII